MQEGREVKDKEVIEVTFPRAVKVILRTSATLRDIGSNWRLLRRAVVQPYFKRITVAVIHNRLKGEDWIVRSIRMILPTSGQDGNYEKLLNSRSVYKVKLTEYDTQLNVSCERKGLQGFYV